MTRPLINLEIITPEKFVLKAETDFVALPAFEGELGVLPGHAPLLARLVPGELRIHKGEETQFFAVSGGFAEVHPDRIEVFAETAEMAVEIDIERARMAAEKSREEISKAVTPRDMAGAQAALRRALIRLHVAGEMSKRKLQGQGH